MYNDNNTSDSLVLPKLRFLLLGDKAIKGNENSIESNELYFYGSSFCNSLSLEITGMIQFIGKDNFVNFESILLPSECTFDKAKGSVQSLECLSSGTGKSFFLKIKKIYDRNINEVSTFGSGKNFIPFIQHHSLFYNVFHDIDPTSCIVNHSELLTRDNYNTIEDMKIVSFSKHVSHVSFLISDFSQLKTLVIMEKVFVVESGVFMIKNCENLISIVIGEKAFTNFTSFSLEGIFVD